MKRSEAIHLLTQRLRSENLTRISANSQEEELASTLLTFLEREICMVPPFSVRMLGIATSILSIPDGCEWDPEEEHV